MNQALITAGLGLFLYVVGQFVLTIVLHPLVDLRRSLADVRFYRRKWANRYMTKEMATIEQVGEDNWKEMRLAQDELRMIWAKVGRDRAAVWPRRLSRLYRAMQLTPSKRDLDKVEGALMLLSNSVFNANFEHIAKANEEIDSILG